MGRITDVHERLAQQRKQQASYPYVWDAYTWQGGDPDGYRLTYVADPTSFHIINEFTGECFNSLVTFIASFDLEENSFGNTPIADAIYSGVWTSR